MLRAHPDMEIDPTVPLYPFVQWDGKVVREIAQVRFKPGVDPDKVAVRDRLRQGGRGLLRRCSSAARRRARSPRARASRSRCRRRIRAAISMSAARRGRPISRLRARAAGGAGQHRQGDPRGRPRDPVGRLPGSAGLRRLLQGPAGRLQEADLRHAGPAGRCGAGRCRAGLSPLLRLAGRRASGAAQGRRHPGRDARRHRGRHEAARSTSSISRCPRNAPTRPSTRRCGTGSDRPAPSSISACCTTTTKRATERASPSRRNSSRISGSRPNAAGGEPSRAGCPACSKGIVLLRRHSDG